MPYVLTHQWRIGREVNRLIRALPRIPIVINRMTKVYGTMGQSTLQPTPVFTGEAVVWETQGSVTVYISGQHELISLTLLVPGDRDIRQGDFLDYGGRTFQVTFAPTFWKGFRVLNLRQWEQK